MIVFSVFSSLLFFTLLKKSERRLVLERTRHEWSLDCLSLFMQGVAIPALQIGLGYWLFSRAFPQWKGGLDLSPLLAFALNFVVVDYLYYWNHRILHHPKLWSIHQVHHSSKQFDLLVTSRNTAWTPIFIVYLWVNGFLLFVLKNPAAFAAGASLGAGLDLWRHTRFSPKHGSWVERVLSPWLILPVDHSWHHSQDVHDVNFGANLKIWDRLHGTLHAVEHEGRYAVVGTKIEIPFIRQCLWPFGRNSS